METSIKNQKEKIRKEMNKILFQIEMNKLNNEKFPQLKEAFNNLKTEYKHLLIEEKLSSKI